MIMFSYLVNKNCNGKTCLFKVECCFCRSSWIHCWLLLAFLSDFFGHRGTSTFLLCKFRDLPGSTPDIFSAVESVLELRDRLNQVTQLPGNGLRKHAEAEADVKRETPNPGRVCSILNRKNKFEYCHDLWKQNIFHNPVRKLKA